MLHALVRKKNEKRGRSWKPHMDFTLDFGKTTALKDALFLLMQELISFPTLLLPAVDAQGNHGIRKEMVCWQTRGDIGDSRGTEFLYEAKTVAIQGDIEADKERQKDFREQHASGLCRRSLTFILKFPRGKGLRNSLQAFALPKSWQAPRDTV